MPILAAKPPPPDPELERFKLVRFVRAQIYDMEVTRLTGRTKKERKVKVRVN